MTNVPERPILLVEDNDDDAELTTRALQQNGVRNPILHATDGALAIELLYGAKSKGQPPPVIVLLDLNLPKIGGIDVLKRIRAEPTTRLLPVIILTSSKEDRDLVDSYQFGANSYVRKPVDFDEFLKAARQLSLYWLMLNEPPPTG